MINNVYSFHFLSGSLRISQMLRSLGTSCVADSSHVAGGASTLDSVLQILGLLVLFIIIIASSYFVTRKIGQISAGSMHNNNISIVDTYKISTTKYIQIVKVAGKCFAIAVGKEEITLLGEIDEDNLIKREEAVQFKSFKEMLDMTVGKVRKGK